MAAYFEYDAFLKVVLEYVHSNRPMDESVESIYRNRNLPQLVTAWSDELQAIITDEADETDEQSLVLFKVTTSLLR